MAYVPITPTVATPPSPRTRELAGLLAQVLEEYTKAHPATTRAEIRAAVRMAQMSAGGNQATMATVVSLVVGLVVMFLGVGLLYFRSAGEADFTLALPGIVAIMILILAIVLIVVRTRS